jgi:hypothetical protein
MCLFFPLSCVLINFHWNNFFETKKNKTMCIRVSSTTCADTKFLLVFSTCVSEHKGKIKIKINFFFFLIDLLNFLFLSSPAASLRNQVMPALKQARQ